MFKGLGNLASLMKQATEISGKMGDVAEGLNATELEVAGLQMAKIEEYRHKIVNRIESIVKGTNPKWSDYNDEMKERIQLITVELQDAKVKYDLDY